MYPIFNLIINVTINYVIKLNFQHFIVFSGFPHQIKWTNGHLILILNVLHVFKMIHMTILIISISANEPQLEDIIPSLLMEYICVQWSSKKNSCQLRCIGLFIVSICVDKLNLYQYSNFFWYRHCLGMP